MAWHESSENAPRRTDERWAEERLKRNGILNVFALPIGDGMLAVSCASRRAHTNITPDRRSDKIFPCANTDDARRRHYEMPKANPKTTRPECTCFKYSLPFGSSLSQCHHLFVALNENRSRAINETSNHSIQSRLRATRTTICVDIAHNEIDLNLFWCCLTCHRTMC